MPRTLFRYAALTLGLTAGSGSLGAQVSSITDLRAAWIQDFEQQDVDAVIGLYTPDAVFLTPEGGRYDDRAAIRTLYKSLLANFRSHIVLTSRRTDCSDKLCVDEGTYDETVTENATGKKLELSGSYVLVARRQPDASWKIGEMIWTGGLGGPR